jgi:hypothetical protein
VKFAAICMTAFILGSCAKNIDTQEAVKEGVIKDIAKKVDIGAMDVNVDSVSFREKEADAKVSFTPKGADRSQSIVMNYVLERQGDEWHIKSRDMQTAQHTGQAPAHPGAIPPGTPLPPGHPTVPANPKP